MPARIAADDALVTSGIRLHPMAYLVRRLSLALGLMAALWLFPATTPAVAKVVPVEVSLGTTSNFGLQPREAGSVFEGMPTVESFNNSEGNLVLHKNETYAIYWDPTDHYHGDWQHLIDTFFQGLGADSGSTGTVFAVDSQYTDKSDLPASYLSTLHGAYTYTDPYPVASNCKDPNPLEALKILIGPVVAGEHTEVCLTDPQIRAELKTFIAAHGLQKGVGSIFDSLTPPAVTVCLQKEGEGGANHCSDHTGSIESYKNSFCSYHSDSPISPSKTLLCLILNTILYGVIPWSAGGLGDYHLKGAADETSAYDCQDGGWYFNPKTSEEEKETSKVSPKEEEDRGEKKKRRNGLLRKQKKPRSRRHTKKRTKKN